jgi:hypothetical protein
MKYEPLIHPDWTRLANVSEAQRTRIGRNYAALTAQIGVVAFCQLQQPDIAAAVRVGDAGEVALADGPAHERSVGGLLPSEAENVDVAIELDVQTPAARMRGAVDVGPMAEARAPRPASPRNRPRPRP